MARYRLVLVVIVLGATACSRGSSRPAAGPSPSRAPATPGIPPGAATGRLLREERT